MQKSAGRCMNMCSYKKKFGSSHSEQLLYNKTWEFEGSLLLSNNCKMYHFTLKLFAFYNELTAVISTETIVVQG